MSIQLPQTGEGVPQCSLPEDPPQPAKLCWKKWFTYEQYELGTQMEDYIFYNVTLVRDIEKLKTGSFFEQVCWSISQLRVLLYPQISSSKYFEAKLDFKLRKYRGVVSDIPIEEITDAERNSVQNMLDFHGVNYHDFFHYLYEEHLPTKKDDFKFWLCRINYDLDKMIRKGMMFYQISWLPSCSTAIFYPMAKTGNIIVRRLTYGIWSVNELEDMEYME
jgi:hypothetical protein